MTDIQGLRAQLRDKGHQPAARVSSGGGSGVPFWLIAAAAAGVGFAIVLLAPRFYTTQRTAALPVSQAITRAEAPDNAQHAAAPQGAGSVQAPAPSQAPAPAAEQPAPPVASRYAGRTPEEVVRLVEFVCDDRARVRGAAPGPANAPKTAADERLYCSLTEAPFRFCAPNQKRKATADIINYFKGVEYKNTAISVAAKLQGGARSAQELAVIDPKVVEAIEGLIRAGYLTKAHRDDINGNVPAEYKARFVPIIPTTPNCPKPPWWAQFL
jgi:hypothetical protein